MHASALLIQSIHRCHAICSPSLDKHPPKISFVKISFVPVRGLLLVIESSRIPAQEMPRAESSTVHGLPKYASDAD